MEYNDGCVRLEWSERKSGFEEQRLDAFRREASVCFELSLAPP